MITVFIKYRVSDYAQYLNFDYNYKGEFAWKYTIIASKLPMEKLILNWISTKKVSLDSILQGLNKTSATNIDTDDQMLLILIKCYVKLLLIKTLNFC